MSVKSVRSSPTTTRSANGTYDFIVSSFLAHISCRSSLDGSRDRVIPQWRHQQDRNLRVKFVQGAGEFNAIAIRQVDIDEHHVGCEFTRQRDRLMSHLRLRQRYEYPARQKAALAAGSARWRPHLQSQRIGLSSRISLLARKLECTGKNRCVNNFRRPQRQPKSNLFPANYHYSICQQHFPNGSLAIAVQLQPLPFASKQALCVAVNELTDFYLGELRE